MRKWFVLAGLAALGTGVISTRGFEAFSDPWEAHVTIQKSYHPNGSISCEAPLNRRHELQGWRVLYDKDGRIISEVFYDRGVWVLSRAYDYKTGLLTIGDARFAKPRYGLKAIPNDYREYRRIEKSPEHSVAE